MRASTIVTTAALLTSPAALAQTAPTQPPALDAAPAATAAFDQRETWCEQYTTWLIDSAPKDAAAPPADVRATHHYEVEFNSCKIDPQQYQRETSADANVILESDQG